MMKLLMITLILLTSSCKFGGVRLPETGILPTYSLFIDKYDKPHCVVYDYDYDIGEKVSDAVKTELINCHQIQGVSKEDFFGIIEPNIQELDAICYDSKYCKR
jgi:hypothetical protein